MSVHEFEFQPDAATRGVLELIAQSGVAPMHEQTVCQARDGMLAGKVNDVDPPPVYEVIDRSIPGPGGHLTIRIYRPRTAPAGKLSGALVYFHGGGFVIGDLETHDNLCRSLSLLADLMVVSVNYRLAPEHRYPAAVEDALAAFEWVHSHADELAIDASRLSVGGDSAGGGLAAVVAHAARDRDIALQAQLLIYPVVDLVGDYPSAITYAKTYPISKPVLDWFWTHYFGADRVNDHNVIAHPWASPLLSTSFRGLAPAYVLTAGMDPLRDQGAAYARALAGAGVDTEYCCILGTIHGFLRLGRLIPRVSDSLASMGAFLKRRSATNERAMPCTESQ